MNYDQKRNIPWTHNLNFYDVVNLKFSLYTFFFFLIVAGDLVMRGE